MDNNNQPPKKKLATERHPTIDAILNELFRFNTVEQVKHRLDIIRSNFIKSNETNDKPNNNDSFRLWIRGYMISEDEEKKGYLGNFARITWKKLPDGKYTICAAKEQVDIKYHPQRVRPKRKHPDWGHPSLRRILTNKPFFSFEQAQEVLDKVYEDHPEVCIPNRGKLFTIIYSQQTQPPINKYVLEIKSQDNGSYIIEVKQNMYIKRSENNSED